MAGKLTKRAQIFVKEYRVDRNATRAAIKAGYSKKTASAAASRLLRNVNVAALVNKLDRELEQKLDLSAERTLKEIARIAFLDARRFFHANGRPKQITELDDDAAAALVGMDVEELWEGSGRERERVGDIKKYKLADKLQALQMMAKYHKLFYEAGKLELTGADGGPIEVNDARTRLAALLGR